MTRRRGRYAIRWTQPDGETGLGDAFDSRERCAQVCRQLAAMYGRNGMRYEVYDTRSEADRLWN